MRRMLVLPLILLLVLPLVLSACSKEPRLEAQQGYGRFFAEYGVSGSFVLYDPRRDALVIHDRDFASRGFPPCSTFKVPLSLMAIETKAVSGPSQLFKWDGKTRQVPEWNRDLNLMQAFQVSAVWVYQEVAAGMGRESIRQKLAEMKYGNAEVTGADPFWIDGDLRISALGQVDFLRRLVAGELGFSRTTVDDLKDMMLVEQDAEGRKVFAKTGLTESRGVRLGWYVGWVEKDGKSYPFALNILSDNPRADFSEARKAIADKILRSLFI